MPTKPSPHPLAGIKVIECSRSVAAAYCGRLLSVMGADVMLVEPRGGNPLRQQPPFVAAAPDTSALFAYLAAGKGSVVLELGEAAGRAGFERLLEGAAVLIDDTPVANRAALGIDAGALALKFPDLIHLSVLPFGSHGPKAGWQAHEINAIHAAGEGFLLPNGLSVELFPDRPPLKIYGHFTAMQGGISAALAALSALWAGRGQSIDVSVQDAGLAVCAFAVQRLGDGSLEHRLERSFKFGGVLECRDGHVELLTLEERQWAALIELMGKPAWATDGTLIDSIERSRRGAEINTFIRAWAKQCPVADLVHRAQALGVPMAPYNSPADVLHDPHEQERGLFQEVDIPGCGPTPMLVAPFQIDGTPFRLRGGPPELGRDNPAAIVAQARINAGAGE